MSMISELVKGLRKLGNQWKHNDVAGCNLIFDAADTIEVLSEKVRANNLYGEWIPVSEALPEEDVDVLITYRYREGEGDTSGRYIDTTSYGDFYFGGREIKDYKHWRQPFAYFDQNYEVIAWMPLPEVYRGGEA